MDEDEKIEMRGNQHRTKPSFGIMQESKQTWAKSHGYGRTDGRAWKGDGTAWLLDSGPNCIWILHGMV